MSEAGPVAAKPRHQWRPVDEAGVQAMVETAGSVGGRRLGPTGSCPWSDTARMWVLAFEALAGMPAGPWVVTEGACESDHRTRTRPKTLV